MEPNIKHLLVFRFSAMGDVALTVPVLRNVLENNKDIKITLVTNPVFIPFFFGMDRLTIFPTDFKEEYHGLKGLFRLFRDLQSADKYDYIIDLHNVIRSRILTIFFSSAGLKSYRIDKGRKEKREVITGKRKENLIHTTERYQQVFEHILPVILLPISQSILPTESALENAGHLSGKKIFPLTNNGSG